MRIKERQKQGGQLYCKGRLGVGTTGQIRVKSLVSVVVKKNMLTEAQVALESLVMVVSGLGLKEYNSQSLPSFPDASVLPAAMRLDLSSVRIRKKGHIYC